MSDRMIKTAHAYRGNLGKYEKRYKYQPDLTPRLDALPDEPFSQQTVYEIVLWKLNRYVRIPEAVRESLHGLRTLRQNEHRKSEPVLLNLLECDGVDLPMASTFLRFQNAVAFQIIDKRAYRTVFGERYRVYPATPPHRKVSVYFKYLDSLIELAEYHRVPFSVLDRILYVFDKEHNGAL